MRIRWKFLLVLLAISLIPMLLMRWMGQRSMRELGNDLATRTRDVLIRERSLELKNLVEEHATILRRERDLVEMALQVQASELEKIFAGPSTQIPYDKKGVFGSGDASRIETEPVRNKHVRRMGKMGSRPLDVSYGKLTEWIPSSVSKAEAGETIGKISDMIPVYRSLEHKHPDLIFWQITAFENGIYTVYPALKRMPMMHGELKADWYQLAKKSKQIVWSKPDIDPITMQIVFMVSAPFYKSDGELIGVTAIAVPVDVLLQEDEHLRKLSKNITSLLVRPENPNATKTNGLRIIAREQIQKEMYHHWRVSLEDEWLEFNKPEQLKTIIGDLQQLRTDVRKISYLGQDSLMAYGCIDDYQTALLVIVPEADVVAEANAMESYVRTRIKRQITVTSIVLSIVIIFVICLAFILSRSVTENISRLVNAVRRVASGDFTARVQIKSRDEVGELGRTFNHMVPELEERVAMKQALDVAMEIQQNLLPKEIPRINGLDIAGKSIYCDETGGDFYDFLEICHQPSDRIAVAVGDVSGHGISAALLMASVRAFFRSRVRQPGSAADIVSDVNHLVAEDTDESGHFMTLFYAEIAPGEKTLRWVRAGHDPALYYDPATGQFQELRGNGMALGVDSQLKYEENAIDGLSDGQILMLGTDGLWETQNEKGEMFGKERLKPLIKQNAHLSSEEIIASIIEELKAFRKSIRQADDITLVVIKIDESHNFE
jgi:sigma-B regulation protein RsbU (phosphoserine phosphatase)